MPAKHEHPRNTPAPSWVYDDGGRAAAGWPATTHDPGDCVARALAIATGEPYADVYAGLAALASELGGRRSARDGVSRQVYDRWLADRGWAWVATMRVGQGCQVHLRADELPAGRVIVRLSGHLAAVIDGAAHDTADPTRGGSRCVYGYWVRSTP